ncbi:MAG: hypothetical protein FJW23_01740 [Acidimicrobiia bacterium]|nr:hypothetical protein [Acidimicrobiia bacterium]
MVWKIPKLVAGDKLQVSFTLAGAPTPELLKGMDGSTIHWEKPGRAAKGSPPIMVYRDLRVPDKGDHERMRVPTAPPPPAAK